MPYVIVEDFAGGVDVRKGETTAPPGTARSIVNAHITRGGEIEKRKAFILVADFDAVGGSIEILPGGGFSSPGTAQLVGLVGDDQRRSVGDRHYEKDRNKQGAQ